MREHAGNSALWTSSAFLWVMYIFMHSAANAEQSRSASGSVTKLLLGVFVRRFNELPTEKAAQLMDNAGAILRKCAHVAVFLILAALIFMAIYSICRRKRPLSALLFTIAFAAADEFHQMLIPGRGPSISDVAIDSCGAALGILLLLAFFRQDRSGLWEERQ